MIEESYIHLLPDSICNQIAAGEVIQRPASAVKELLENSIDARSTKITLVIEEGGKDLIQVIDNGIGMSDIDSRMCLEKHATSKIKTAEDLYNIKSFGFRGEAIPSIISIARVEITTRTKNSDMGTRLIVERSEVISQEPYVTPVGTNFIVRNIFFNIPARRAFLKDSYIETQHVLKEFNNIALANCDVEFVFINSGKEILHLYPTSLINRIGDLFGEQYKKQLIKCEEEDMFVKMKGYIGLPQAVRKYKKENFLFVNNRHVKSQYINQAIVSAYADFIGNDKIPFYFLFLTVDTKDLDVNIHPAKTEVKFQNEEVVYSFIRNSIKRLLYKNDLPKIDFDLRENIVLCDELASSFKKAIQGENIYKNDIKNNEEVNLFNKDQTQIPTDEDFFLQKGDVFNKEGRENHNEENLKYKAKENVIREKEKIDYPSKEGNDCEDIKGTYSKVKTEKLLESENISEEGVNSEDGTVSSQVDSYKNPVMFIKPCYIFSTVKSGVIFIHERRAHTRILYEELIREFKEQGTFPCEQLLFPKIIVVDKKEMDICLKNKNEIKKKGFCFDIGNEYEIIITGIPSAEMSGDCIEDIFRDVVACIGNGEKIDLCHVLAKNISVKRSIKQKTYLSNAEMLSIVSRLFSCENPHYDLSGKRIFFIIKNEEIDSYF